MSAPVLEATEVLEPTEVLEAPRADLPPRLDEFGAELDAIRQRYTDVKPYVSAAAVVFALTAADVAAWGAGR